MRIVNYSVKDLDIVELKTKSSQNFPSENYLSDYEISIKEEKNLCVGRVDMLNSSKITAALGLRKAGRYHQLFLNSMAYVLEHFGGYLIKIVDGSMLYYFPESGKRDGKFCFMSCIECGLAMTQIRQELCKNAEKEGLPKIEYATSAEYGKVTVINTNESRRVDLLGSPMNACSKMIQKTLRNKFIIGKNLYEIAKYYEGYDFMKIETHPEYQYDNQIFVVTRNQVGKGKTNV